ncbi:TlpA disulfide reductase family protein [Spirosoma sp. SC4-14]|uniref:TlpA disulfide reductase family protein n=1 Tax=Spirosoma sp. SC4-14 TaxID=3128900 RepID=UPI0030CF6B26
MKTISWVAIVSLSPLLVWAQGGSYTIQGKLNAVQAPAKAYLRYPVNGTVKMDSATIQNGSFAFKGTTETPVKGTLLVDKQGQGFSNRRPIPAISIYLEPGVITVSSPDSLKNAEISGTPLNVDNQKLELALKPSQEKMDLLMKEYRSATPAQRSRKEFEESIDKRYEAIEAEKKGLYEQFIKSMPQSLVSLDALKQFGGYTPEYNEVKPIFDGLSDAVKTSRAGEEYAATLNRIKATSIGELAPDFMQADTAGKMVALHDFKGKYVLVDFWASWCGPCRAENPNVVKNYNEYKGRNFTVLGVSLDRPTAKEAWLRAIHKDNLTWTHVSDLKFWDNEVARQYNIRAIPQNFLIGPDGKIVAKNVRGEALGKKLAEVLAGQP